MNITRESILERLNAYLNHRMTLDELVKWGHTALIEARFPETEEAELLLDILLHMAAADTASYPLTWEVISEMLHHLGGSAKVILKVA